MSKNGWGVNAEGYSEQIKGLRSMFVRRLSLQCSLCGMVVMDYAMADHLWNGSVGVYQRTVKEIWAHVKAAHPEEIKKKS